LFILFFSVVFAGKDIRDGTEELPYPTSFVDDYNATKAEAEQIVVKANGKDNGTENGLMTVAIRIHTVYGPGDELFWPNVIEKAREGKLKWKLGRKDVYSSFTFIDNACTAHLLAADHLTDKNSKACGNIYHINDGEKQNFWEVLFDVSQYGSSFFLFS